MTQKLGMTADQARATQPSLTAWVGASAGTGKTHVLTARVLRLMLTGIAPENIVCLTFTKAAATEMKNRIFAELGRWTTMPDEKLQAEIYARVDETADADMLKNARQLFARVLDMSGGLQIQTFHSFCQALLGRFPLEANMIPGFEGLDESEASELMGIARDQMLEQTRDPNAMELRRALDVVAGLVTERTFDEVINRLSFEAPLLARASNAYGGIDGVVRALYARLGITVGQSTDSVVSAAFSAALIDEAGLRALAAGLADGSASDQKRGQAIADMLAGGEQAVLKNWPAYKSAFLTKEGKPLVTVATKKVVNANPALLDVIAVEQARLLALIDTITRIEAAQTTAALLRLGLTQISLYERMKSERGFVDFDDMIGRTVGLFAGSQIAPWILYKLDNRIDHILVDEAQDTNRDQWRIVETLAAEFFAGESARGEPRTVFAVGDAKQSIFSFQRADPREFVAARNRVFERAYHSARQAEAVPLSLSFRSGEAVLSLVDAVFHRTGRGLDGLSFDGEDVRHHFSRAGQAGLVELWPLEAPAVAPDVQDNVWQPPVAQETVDDAEQRAAWRIARHIKGSIGTRELTARARKVAAGDVLVLVRRRTAFVDHLVRALKILGVPVAGRDRMTLMEELPVMDLLAAVRFALLPTDDLTLATVLKSPLIGCGEETLFNLAHGRKGSLWDALYRARRNAEYAPLYNRLVDILNRADIDGPFAFLNYLLIDLNGREKLASRMGAEIHDPVDELLDEALRYELTRTASLLGFAEHVTRNNTHIKRDMEEAGDTVRIMTAHSAKGLQAPIVYVSDLVSTPDITKDARLLPLKGEEAGMPPIPVWASHGKGLEEVDTAREAMRAVQLAEYRRLLYVALTRAEDELYVAGWRGPREPEPDCWFSLVKEGFERLETTDIILSDGRVVTRYAIEQTQAPKADAKADTRRREAAVPPGWLFKSRPDEPAPTRPLAPSRPDAEPAVTGPFDRSEKERSRYQRGQLLHALLEWLPDMPADKRAQAAIAYLENNADLSSEARVSFWHEVEAVLDHPDFSAIFGPESRAEVPIAGLVTTPGAPKGRPVSGQVDRLVVTDDAVLIIDYKTNRPPPQTAGGVAPVYLKQMGLYRRALMDIYPDRPVKAALLWTHGARLMPLPDKALEDALQEADI